MEPLTWGTSAQMETKESSKQNHKINRTTSQQPVVRDKGLQAKENMSDEYASASASNYCESNAVKKSGWQ